MAILERDLERGDRPDGPVDLEELWRASPAGPVRDARVSGTRTHTAWNRRLIVAWLAMLVVLGALQPSPNAGATLPVWAEVTDAVFLLALIASLIALASGRPSGIGLSGGTALMAFGMAAACGVTGHHPAAWVGFEVVVSAALVGVHWMAFRGRSRT